MIRSVAHKCLAYSTLWDGFWNTEVQILDRRVMFLFVHCFGDDIIDEGEPMENDSFIGQSALFHEGKKPLFIHLCSSELKANYSGKVCTICKLKDEVTLNLIDHVFVT